MAANLPRAALWYARHGWKVFPLRPRTKEPFGNLGVYHATTDADQIGAWWAQWPTANIGLHCGGSNLLALDLDSYKDGYNGNGPITRSDEDTVRNLTGRGGTHLLYSTPPEIRYTNAAGNLAPCIDVKAWGGYIVLPPSIHPDTGTLYHWELGYGPHERSVLPLPHALRAILDEAAACGRTPGPPNDIAVAASYTVVESLLDLLDLPTLTETEYDTSGRRWILRQCPFNPENDPHANDRAAYIIIAKDGYIAAGCQHERCRRRLRTAQLSGWKFLVEQAKGS